MPYNYESSYYQTNPYYNTGVPTQSYYPSNYQNSAPMQSQTQMPQQSSSNPGFVWVQGEAGAKAYPVAAGNSVLLMDSENPVLYMKSTDQSGRPLPIEIYDLVKRQENHPQIPQPIDLSGYVKMSELDGILEKKVQLMVNKALGGE